MRAFCRYNNHSMYRYNNRAFGCGLKPGNWFLPYTKNTPVPNHFVTYINGRILTAMQLSVNNKFTYNDKNIYALMGDNITRDPTREHSLYDKNYDTGSYGVVLDDYTETGNTGTAYRLILTYGVSYEDTDFCQFTLQGENIKRDGYKTIIDPYYDPFNTYFFNKDYILEFYSGSSWIYVDNYTLPEPDKVYRIRGYIPGYYIYHGSEVSDDFIIYFDAEKRADGSIEHFALDTTTGELYRSGILYRTYTLYDKNVSAFRFYNERGNDARVQLKQFYNNDIGIQCSTVEIVSVDCHIGYDADGNRYILDSTVYKPGTYQYKTMNIIRSEGWYHIGYLEFDTYGSWTPYPTPDHYPGIFMNDNWELSNPNISHYEYGYVFDKFDLDGDPIYPYTRPAYFDNMGEMIHDRTPNKYYTYGNFTSHYKEFNFVFDKERILYGISNDSYKTN